MNDTPELLPKSREYFRKFLQENKQDYFDAMREYRVGPGSGYGYFYKSSEVVQLMRDMYHNLDETFGNLTIPGEFPSPKRLAQTWKWFHEYLKGTDELFKEIKEYIINHYEVPKGETIENMIRVGFVFPDPLVAIDRYRVRLIEVLEYILALEEVQIELTHSKKTNGSSEQKNLSVEKEVERTGVYHPGYLRENHLFDIAIITAINKPELSRVKEIIEDIERLPVEKDPTIYHKGHFNRNNGDKISVVVGCDDKMGMPAASSLSMKMIYNFRPKYLVMLGICAGIEGKVKLGDILVADLVWDYGSGKYELIKPLNGQPKQVFIPYINQIQLDVHVEGILKSICSEGKYVDEIQSNWNKVEKKVPGKLRAKSGPFASGSAVIADENIVSQINEKHGKLLGFDMETYGVYNAARYCPFDVKPIAIKSVSDYGNSNKNNSKKDLYQDYAAYTSAQFFREIAVNEFDY